LPADGDADGQGDVDDDDLAIVVSNLGSGIALPQGGLSLGGAVPEPTAIVLALLGLAASCTPVKRDSMGKQQVAINHQTRKAAR
jgi:hypothetical protein